MQIMMEEFDRDPLQRTVPGQSIGSQYDGLGGDLESVPPYLMEDDTFNFEGAPPPPSLSNSQSHLSRTLGNSHTPPSQYLTPPPLQAPGYLHQQHQQHIGHQQQQQQQQQQQYPRFFFRQHELTRGSSDQQQAGWSGDNSNNSNSNSNSSIGGYPRHLTNMPVNNTIGGADLQMAQQHQDTMHPQNIASRVGSMTHYPGHIGVVGSSGGSVQEQVKTYNKLSTHTAPGPSRTKPRRPRLVDESLKALSVDELRKEEAKQLVQLESAKHKHRKNVSCNRCKVDQRIRQIRKLLENSQQVSEGSVYTRSFSFVAPSSKSSKKRRTSEPPSASLKEFTNVRPEPRGSPKLESPKKVETEAVNDKRILQDSPNSTTVSP